MKPVKTKHYQILLDKIGATFKQHQKQAIAQIYSEKLHAYWSIGQHIVEYEQEGKIKAEYGKQLLVQLAKDLRQYGKGFSRTNLIYMRLFYTKYPKSQTLSDFLSWSHFTELLSISDGDKCGDNLMLH